MRVAAHRGLYLGHPEERQFNAHGQVKGGRRPGMKEKEAEMMGVSVEESVGYVLAGRCDSKADRKD